METKSEVQVFDKAEFGSVRVIMQDNEPWFVAKDVATILGYSNPQKAIRDHVDAEDCMVNETFTLIQGSGSNCKSNAVLINESGLYSLILSSKLPTAKQFKRWVTSEVLPSIRKHGVYATQSVVEQTLADPDAWIQILQALKQERLAKEKAERKILEDKPKVELANAVSSSDTSVLIGVLAKILKQNGVEIGQNRLFSWMRKNGYLTQKNDPTQKAMDMGLFDIHERNVKFGDDKEHLVRTTKVTGKGQVYFINIFLTGDFKNEING